MRSVYKPNFDNRPKHIQVDESFYFFTIRTIEGQWFLRPDYYKQILLKLILDKAKKFGFPLIAYAILQNHYHLLLKITDSIGIPKLIAELNGASARAINKAEAAVNRKVWWNYYDHIIRNEVDFFKHLNYIHQNPIKHKLTKSLHYQFSSYDGWIDKKGEAYLNHAFEKYPIVDFVMQGDDY